jgi:hypothetical protein
MPWGGGSTAAIDLLAALAVRENVVRLSFSAPVYYSGLLDSPDASRVDKFTVAVVAGTVGMDGSAVRAVTVVYSQLPGEIDGLSAAQVGYFLDLVLDRPMTPHPALYLASVAGVFSSDLSDEVSASVQVPAVFRKLAVPQADVPRLSRDFANAQAGVIASDGDPLNLGTLRVDDTGDYAFDEGLTNFRKRAIRRLVTRKGGFAHLPTYGVGVPYEGKRLATSAVLSRLAADAEAQIGLEPEAAAVRVRPVVDPSVPGLVRFPVVIKPKVGKPQAFDVPFLTQ